MKNVTNKHDLENTLYDDYLTISNIATNDKHLYFTYTDTESLRCAIKKWSIDTEKVHKIFKDPSENEINSIVIDKQGKYFFTRDIGGKIMQWGVDWDSLSLDWGEAI